MLRVAPADGPADGLGVRGTGTGAGAFRGAGVRAGVGRAEPERDTGELGAAVRAGELRGAAGPPGWRAPGVPDGLTPHSLVAQNPRSPAFAPVGAPKHRGSSARRPGLTSALRPTTVARWS